MPVVDIVLMRHATAKPLHAGTSDKLRELTLEGHVEAASMAGLIAPALSSRTILCSSPAVRAMQTAAAISKACGIDVTIERRLGLDSSADDVLDVIRELASTPVVIVGHLPVVAQVAATLLDMPFPSLTMPPGAAIGLQWYGKAKGSAVLQWMVTPALSA